MADNEDLIDYEDDQELVTNGVPAANGAAVAVTGADGDEKEKKSYVGIHSTGFRCVFSIYRKDLSSWPSLYFLKRFPVETRAVTCY